MKIIICITLFILFILWTILLVKNKLSRIDDIVYNKIKLNNKKTIFFKYFTNLASTKYFIIICLLLIIFLKNKLALLISIAMIIDAIIVFIAKHIIKRERPNINRIVEEKGYSYPSGHTFSATCFYGLVMFLINISSITLGYQLLITIALISIILLIGFSRIYLGVHYFSDCIGGLLLSSSYIILYVYLVYDVLKLL
jgi:undecaprenyl-diphosphatase